MTDAMVDYQKAFLLLQLLGAENGNLTKGEANKALTRGGNQRLGLAKAGDANAVRDSLCPRYIKKTNGRSEKGGRIELYELTEEGRACLLQLPLYPLEIQIPGRAITRLVEIARHPRASHDQLSNTASLGTSIPSVDLEQEVLRAFDELRRERYGHTRLVPIWDVRKSIRARCGDHAARHGVLDEVILTLWRNRQVRLVPVNDGRGVTSEELGDAIPGDHETWFYLEPWQ